ncbi:MAG: single-stranded DNA-binding protein [Anaerolineales bacterium]|nr:single-stranded DNA-binding protein [Anaerolineales bacterium]
MPGLNRVQIIGRLGKDPETRFTSTGKQVCSFSVAVGRNWRDPEGQNKEVTDWFKIETWGKLSEVCQKYLTKGRLVYIEGRLQTDRYEVDGEVRYSTRIVAREMQMLDRKPEEVEAVLIED